MTDKTGHTPGLWVLDGPDPFNDYSIMREGRNLAIACVCNGAINELAGHGEEHKANARLISAAPELLEALKRARGSVQWAIKQQDIGSMGRQVDESVLAQMLAAIAKAEGRV